MARKTEAASAALVALTACLLRRPRADPQMDPEIAQRDRCRDRTDPVLRRQVRACRWFATMEPRLTRYVAGEGAPADPRRRALRGAPRRHPARTRARRDGRREPLRSIRRVLGRCDRPDAGDALLAARTRHDQRPPPCNRRQRAHGHDHPRLLPAQGARQLPARAAALQRQPRPADVFRRGARPVRPALARRGIEPRPC